MRILMKTYADFHVHTNFSGDSITSMEDMLLQSINLNHKMICFTDHYDMDFPYRPTDDTNLFELNTNLYINEIQRLKSLYKNTIDIQVGVELGLMPHLANKINDYTSAYPFDFIIGSSHTCHGVDPYHKEFFENR